MHPVYIGIEGDLNELKNDHIWLDGNTVTPPIEVFAYNAEDIKIEAPIKNPIDPWRVKIEADTIMIFPDTQPATLSGAECSFSALGKCTFDNLKVLHGNVNANIPVVLRFSISYQGGDTTTIDSFDAFVIVDPTTPTTTSMVSTTSSSLTTESTTASSTSAMTTTQSSSSTSLATTSAKTTTILSHDLDCTIKKRKLLICSDRNLLTGKNLAAQIMNLSSQARDKIKMLDISKNPNLNQQKLKSIINQLPKLTTLKVLM